MRNEKKNGNCLIWQHSMSKHLSTKGPVNNYQCMGPVQSAFHGIKKFASHGFAFEKKSMSHARRRWKKLMSHGYIFLKINWMITMSERLVYMYIMLFCIYHTNFILYLLNRCIITKSYLLHIWKLQATYPPPPFFLYICAHVHLCTCTFLSRSATAV